MFLKLINNTFNELKQRTRDINWFILIIIITVILLIMCIFSLYFSNNNNNTFVDVLGDFSDNLIINGGMEDGWTGWDKTDGGTGWYLGADWIAPHSGKNCAVTSYELCTRTQTVKLLSTQTASYLDTSPQIKVSTFFSGKGPQYFMQVDLLDNLQKIVATQSIGSSTDLQTIADNDVWIEKVLLFENYPSGVRYIKYTDGGKDRFMWSGNYGAAMDDTSITIKKMPMVISTPSSTPAYTPAYTPSSTPSSTPAIIMAYTPAYTPASTPAYTPSSTPAYTPSSTPSSTPAYTPSYTPSSTPAIIMAYTPASTPAYTPASTPASTLSPTPSTTPSTTMTTDTSAPPLAANLEASNSGFTNIKKASKQNNQLKQKNQTQHLREHFFDTASFYNSNTSVINTSISTSTYTENWLEYYKYDATFYAVMTPSLPVNLNNSAIELLFKYTGNDGNILSDVTTEAVHTPIIQIKNGILMIYTNNSTNTIFNYKLENNIWYHILLNNTPSVLPPDTTYTINTTYNTSLYINGILILKQSLSTVTNNTPLLQYTALWIGGNELNQNNISIQAAGFKGYIAYARLFNKCFTAAQVEENNTNTYNSAFTPSTTNLTTTSSMLAMPNMQNILNIPNINQLIADIQSKYPNITPDQLTKLINAGVNISSLTDTNGISLNSRGININPNANGPSTNIYQSSINGNTNIYSPYLYYNKSTTEQFTTNTHNYL